MPILIYIISIILGLGCNAPSSSSTPKILDKEKIGVVATIPPIADLAKKIGGDRAEITTLVPPGASPHTYEPLPSQIKAVSQAKMYIQVGSGIEFELSWLDKLLSVNKKILLVDSSEGIQPAEKKIDPHIWLSPKKARLIAENIREGFSKLDPQHQDYYRTNKEILLQQLDELDREITQAMARKSNPYLMVYHPAWTHFCQDYGLIQIPIEQDGKEPSLKKISQLIQKARKLKIKTIITEPEFNSKSAEMIAQEIEGKITPLSPLAENYFEIFRDLIKVLLEE